MKKILGISLVALVVSAPAFAVPDYKSAPVRANPQDDPNLVTSVKRKYAVVDESIGTDHIATTSYVKGAYNATIKAINSLDFASKEGVVSTINKSTVTGTGTGTVTVYNTWGDETENGQGTANVGLSGVSYAIVAPESGTTYYETYSGATKTDHNPETYAPVTGKPETRQFPAAYDVNSSYTPGI